MFTLHLHETEKKLKKVSILGFNMCGKVCVTISKGYMKRLIWQRWLVLNLGQVFYSIFMTGQAFSSKFRGIPDFKHYPDLHVELGTKVIWTNE